MNLGEIIRTLVDEKGFSDAQFAKLIGQQRQNIKKAVFDKVSLDTNLVCVISEVLDCNLFDYFKCNGADYEKIDLKARLIIEMGQESKDKTIHFCFGENNVELK